MRVLSRRETGEGRPEAGSSPQAQVGQLDTGGCRTSCPKRLSPVPPHDSQVGVPVRDERVPYCYRELMRAC